MDNNLTWSAPEYEDRERSRDWFWALGIIGVTTTIAALIFGNYFFAVLLILSTVLLGIFATKKPEMVSYELNPMGLKIGSRLYPYENIKSFWIQLGKPILFVHSERAFMPILSIPITEDIAPNIHEIMLSQNVAEVEMKEHLGDLIMERLGF